MKRSRLCVFFTAVLTMYSCGLQQPYSEYHHSPTGFNNATRKLFSLVSGRTIGGRISALLGNVLAVQELLAQGADINARDINGRTLLHMVRDEKVAKVLVDNGADPNAKDNRGVTPLHLVKKIEIAAVLTTAKADINARDSDGDTPLHWAADRIDRPLSLFFLQQGADIHAENKIGETPLDLAERNVDEESAVKFKLLSDAYRLYVAKEMRDMYLKFSKVRKDGYRDGFKKGFEKGFENGK